MFLSVQCVLGGWSNTKSVIRKGRNDDPKVEVSTEDIVSESEYRGFWVEFSEGYIAVGRENEDSPFMSWEDPEPLSVMYMGVATGFEADGRWIINEDRCREGRGCADDRVCYSGACVNPCHFTPSICEDDLFCRVDAHATSCFQPGDIYTVSTSDVDYDYVFFPAPTECSVIKFKVKASNDAHFMLAESPNPNVTTDKFEEIVLGGWVNSQSVIRDTRDGDLQDREYFPGILSADQYRGFSVQYVDGNLAVYKENEKNPFLMWTDSNPLDFKYFGVATGFKSTGKWIMYECPP